MRAQRASAKVPHLQQQHKQQQQAIVNSFGKEIGLQTDPYTVTLSAATKESEAAAQTDALRDRPVSPLVALRAEQVDANTQIQDGELFNFDE